MPTILKKVPFFRLTLPLVAGILFQYYFYIHSWSIPLLFVGLGCMLISYFIALPKQYTNRWLFGAGVYIFLFASGIISCSISQKRSTFEFSDTHKSYIGTVTDLPQNKPKSISCKVTLDKEGKKIICYFQKGIRSKQLEIGDEIVFYGKIEHFKNFGNPDEFDYPVFMYNQGYAGSVYLYSDDWEATENKSRTLSILALQCRQKILDKLKSLDLNPTEFSILSAITLGYKNDLSPDIQEAFRTIGTAHVLAVSGMHVGIIYAVIFSIAGIFGARLRQHPLIQVIIIICLWTYAFITGLSPSVIRATILLSVFCISNMIHRKGFSYNNLFIAAFFMLVFNPFWIFDIGFQLSFCAVFSILFFHPVLSELISVRNKYGKYIWNLFTLSLAAQIGTFPVCLYHFGTFPTYFFITNLLIVPLVSVVMCLSVFLIALTFITQLFPDSISEIICYLPIVLLKGSILLMVKIAVFFEELPFAQISNLKISLSLTFCLLLISILVVMFLRRRNAKILIAGLCAILFTFVIQLLPSESKLSIYKKDEISEICWNMGNNIVKSDTSNYNRPIRIGDKNLLSFSSEKWEQHILPATKPFVIDYMHIVNNDSVTLSSLHQMFEIKSVIIDHSLPTSNRKKLIKECKNMGIPYFDMSEKGSFRIIF